MDPGSLTKTSFSGKTVDNVTNNELKEFILNDMKLKCGGISYNSRYAKIYNEQYSRNLNNPHIICLKTSGTPYLLYCTQINGVNYCFLIDKKVKVGYDFPKIFVTPYRFHSSVFTGTLFETELVRDRNQNWSLLLGDIYFHEGANCGHKYIMDRMNVIHGMLKLEYDSDTFSDICPIQVKKYFDFKDKDTIFKEFIPSLSYNVRGLYFVPIKASYSKILYLFKEGELSVKSSNKVESKNDTLNFKLLKTMKRDVYDLYLQGPTNIVKQSIACIPNLKTSQLVRELLKNDDGGGICVECKYNEKFKKWQPLRLSTEIVSRVDEL